jgi:hypothetical protein
MPGHKQGYGNPAMDDVLDTLGKCFRKAYLPDLIARHTDAPSNRQERIAGRKPSPLTQLNTLCLTRCPLKGSANAERYSPSWKIQGKTVLVLDDFCTEGYTLGAARVFLLQAGAKVIEVSWLKTINSTYEWLQSGKNFDPYVPQYFDRKDIHSNPFSYQQYISDPAASTELREAYNLYRNWDFPK